MDRVTMDDFDFSKEFKGALYWWELKYEVAPLAKCLEQADQLRFYVEGVLKTMDGTTKVSTSIIEKICFPYIETANSLYTIPQSLESVVLTSTVGTYESLQPIDIKGKPLRLVLGEDVPQSTWVMGHTIGRGTPYVASVTYELPCRDPKSFEWESTLTKKEDKND